MMPRKLVKPATKDARAKVGFTPEQIEIPLKKIKKIGEGSLKLRCMKSLDEPLHITCPCGHRWKLPYGAKSVCCWHCKNHDMLSYYRSKELGYSPVYPLDPTSPREIVSVTLDAIRAQKGLVHWKVASRAGMETSYYYRIERCELDIRLSTLASLLAAVECTPEEFGYESARILELNKRGFVLRDSYGSRWKISV